MTKTSSRGRVRRSTMVPPDATHSVVIGPVHGTVRARRSWWRIDRPATLRRHVSEPGAPRSRWAAFALLMLVGWFTFPGNDAVAKTGLDPSWVIGLNLFAHDGFRFGRDVIFTYGPLGWVVRPLEVGAHLLIGNWVRVALHLLLLGTALWL